MNRLVSVIIPTHNRPNLVPRAVHSVLAQTYDNLECIIVDDGSDAETRHVLRTFDDDRVQIRHHEENRGAAAARNTGIEAAEGEFIAFVDDDDEWCPIKLEQQVPVLENESHEVALVYCWMDYIDESNNNVREYRPTLEGDIFPEMLDGQRIGNTSTLLVRRSTVEAVGGFDPSLPRGNDGDFIRRICQNHEVRCVREPLVKVHIGHDHERITRYDETGLRNAIKGQKAKLAKFDAELARFPRQRGNIYADIGFHYGQLGDWHKSMTFLGRALWTAPDSPRVYRQLFATIKVGLVKLSKL